MACCRLPVAEEDGMNMNISSANIWSLRNVSSNNNIVVSQVSLHNIMFSGVAVINVGVPYLIGVYIHLYICVPRCWFCSSFWWRNATEMLVYLYSIRVLAVLCSRLLFIVLEALFMLREFVRERVSSPNQHSWRRTGCCTLGTASVGLQRWCCWTLNTCVRISSTFVKMRLFCFCRHLQRSRICTLSQRVKHR